MADYMGLTGIVRWFFEQFFPDLICNCQYSAFRDDGRLEYKGIENGLARLIIGIDEVQCVLYFVYKLQHARPDLDHGKTRTKKARHQTLTV